MGPLQQMISKHGALCFVLHSHIPYVRGTGHWPHGEVWLYEAIAETYLPILESLGRLQSQKLPVQLTLSLTPVLLEQLTDERIKDGFLAYVGERAEAAEADRRYFERSGQPAMQALAEGHLAFYRDSRRAFESRFGGDLVAAFRRLQENGMIELAVSAATHGYLPLLGDASVRLQLRTAGAAYERHFGRSPAAIWLPECGYRPGLEDLLEANGLRLFFAETFMVTGGQPSGVADQRSAGAYASLNPMAENAALLGQPILRSAHQAYYVDGSQVAVLGRDETTGRQVWSGAHGYPGDGAYREFHKQHPRSGLRYWRVTDPSVGLDRKEVYDEGAASRRTLAHANHFTSLVETELSMALESGEESPILVAAYDTELFGHWWAEGVSWLEAVIRKFGPRSDVHLVSASSFVDAHQPQRSVIIPEGSWGVGGGHYVWNNPANAWIWPQIASAESRLAEYAAEDEPDPARKRLLDQAARELLLMQASDWPFLMTSGQAAEFPAERFREHHARFEACLAACENATVDQTLAPVLWEEDRVFPEMDYRWLNP